MKAAMQDDRQRANGCKKRYMDFLCRGCSVSLISVTARCGSPVFGTKEVLQYCGLPHHGPTCSNALVAFSFLK